jgi:pimeloyl-ACP methyl ester carboxylesterase
MTSEDRDGLKLPDGIRQRSLAGINGLTVNVLEAGYETPGRPAVLLLHGFPDLAFSWRKTMLPLAAAGYHVVAPDQRGYGATTGWDDRYDGDVASFRTHSYARDALGVVEALGHRSVAAVVGHDFGSMIAAYCALVRPDVFRSLVMMSFPFDGPPTIPFDTADQSPAPPEPSIAVQLAALSPPRQDSMGWFGTPDANADMVHAPQGLHDFLRAYFHVKSADWPGNRPHPLATGSAAELATLPTYYIMDAGAGMAATVAPDMPTPAEIAANPWLPEAELAAYAAAFGRTGFQGGLNWFRCHTGPIGRSEIELFAGRSIDVPSCFISGAADLGDVPQARRDRAHARNDLHPHGWRSPDRGRRALGAAGAARAVQRDPARVPAAPSRPEVTSCIIGAGSLCGEVPTDNDLRDREAVPR